MRLFSRRSKWEIALASLSAAAANDTVRRATKVGLGVVAGAFSATAASAAVSSARHQDQK